MQDFLQVYLNNVTMICSVLCTFALIHFHQFLTYTACSVVFMGLLSSYSYLIVSQFRFGELNELSLRVLRSWRRNGKETDENSPLMTKYLNGTLDLRIKMGIFVFYRKPTSIKIIGKLVYYTTKFLILTKSFV